MTEKEVAMKFRRQYKRAVANIKVPKELEKDNILKMLEGVEQVSPADSNTAFTAKKKQLESKHVIYFALAVAACAAMVIGLGANSEWFTAKRVLVEKENNAGDTAKVLATFVNREDIEKEIEQVVEEGESVEITYEQIEGVSEAAQTSQEPLTQSQAAQEAAITQEGEKLTHQGFTYIAKTESTSRKFCEKIIKAGEDGSEVASLTLFESQLKEDSLEKSHIAQIQAFENTIIIKQVFSSSTKFIFVDMASFSIIHSVSQSGSVTRSQIIGDRLWIFSEMPVKLNSVPFVTVNGAASEFDVSSIISTSSSKEKVFLVVTSTCISSPENCSKIAILGCRDTAYTDGVHLNVTSRKSDGSELYLFELKGNKFVINGCFVTQWEIVGSAITDNAGNTTFIANVDGRAQAISLDSNCLIIDQRDDVADGYTATKVTVNGSGFVVEAHAKQYQVTM